MSRMAVDWLYKVTVVLIPDGLAFPIPIPVHPPINNTS